jgi:hypothetical protein
MSETQNQKYVLKTVFTLLLMILGCLSVGATTLYVDLNCTAPASPYTSWTTAATNIQDAVDVAVAGDLILVTNGLYQIGARSVYGMSNRVAVTKAVTVQSVNGPDFTIIRGYQVPGMTNGASAVRCAYLTNGAVLAGFTLTNGATQSSGDSGKQRSGGGAWAESASAVVSNCVLAGNSASIFGGGAFASTVNNCTLTGNLAYGGGGGACSNTLNRCTLAGNSASWGGGASASRLNDCTLTGNSAPTGGGAFASTLNNCTLTGNSAFSSGGGGESSSCGGGACFGTLNNCVLTGNSASYQGGGAYYSTLNNSIIYYNAAAFAANYYHGTLNYCCTVPLLISGIANFTNEPTFVNLAGGDLHLQSNSPCINSGANAYVSDPYDLDRNPRIVGGTVDVGAYEYQSPASTISFAWLQQYGLALDGTADFADPDHDGLNNRQEWLAGTDPTNAASALRMASATNALSGIAVIWASVTNRSYWLERETDLSLVPAFSMVWSNIPGLDSVTTFIDTNASGAGPFFYRVRTAP